MDRRPAVALAVAAAALAAVPVAMTVAQASDDRPAERTTVTRATFTAPTGASAQAVTYDPGAVPVGAEALLRTTRTGDGRTTVTLQLSGLKPDRAYGAHLHYRPCGATGAAAGAHYQHHPDPATGGDETAASTDAAYANPSNELWLDLETGPTGRATVVRAVDWQIRGGTPRSVVLHARATSTGAPGDPLPPGGAGPRLACLTVPTPTSTPTS